MRFYINDYTVVYSGFNLLVPTDNYNESFSCNCLFTRSYKASENPTKKFAVVVPAHNEQESLSDTVNSLLDIEYPKDLYDVVVIADNCTDSTAEIAEKMGVKVFKRSHETKRSKGYALEWLFEKLLSENHYDAYVVVDADTLVSSNILDVFNNELLRGKDIIQAYYGVRNPDVSWRTELLSYALALFNGVYLAGFNGLGLGCALRGNGMCFSKEILKKVPWKAASLAEDMECSWLARLQGVKAQYTDEAKVYGEMVSGEHEGTESQRKRWEEGRHQLREMFRDKLMKSDLPALEKALYYCDLFLDPLSKYAAQLVLLVLVAMWADSDFSYIAYLALAFLLFIYICQYRKNTFL